MPDGFSCLGHLIISASKVGQTKMCNLTTTPYMDGSNTLVILHLQLYEVNVHCSFLIITCLSGSHPHLPLTTSLVKRKRSE